MIIEIVGLALVLGLGAATLYRLVKSWRSARSDFDDGRPPKP